jgi:hypothetical protein
MSLLYMSCKKFLTSKFVRNFNPSNIVETVEGINRKFCCKNGRMSPNKRNTEKRKGIDPFKGVSLHKLLIAID